MKEQELNQVQKQRLIQTCSEIIKELVQAHKDSRLQHVNLYGLKSRAAKNNKFDGVPRQVDLIAAIPQEYRVLTIFLYARRPSCQNSEPSRSAQPLELLL
jgi:histone acetyltransferase (RNA polymerase elongator complex component)